MLAAVAIVTVAAVAPDPQAEPTQALASIEGFDPKTLASALELRMPDIRLQQQWSEDDLDAALFIRMRRGSAEGPAVVQVITADGNGYLRILSDSENDERIVATVVANLLIAIADETVTADADALALPESAAPEVVDEAVQALEPEPELPPEPEPEPEPEPQPEPKRQPEPQPDPPAQGEPEPWWAIGVGVSPGALLSVGRPAYGNAFAGAGASVAVDARTPRGFAFGLAFRGLGARKDNILLSRFSVGLRGGWILHQRRFEMPMMAEVAVEPWRLSDDFGDGLSDEDDSTVSPVLRGGLRVAPGARFDINGSVVQALTVHADASLTGGFVIRDGQAAILGINAGTDEDSVPLHRLGGFEAMLGVGVTAWFGLPRRRE